MTELSIFVSSPGDVAEERALAGRVIERLGQEFADRVRLRPVFWEHEPLLASGSFQDQIVRPSETDIVVCILWSRLGTRLPAQFTRDDGSRYASGTEFEFEDAVEGHRQNGTPDLLVYRKTAEPLVSLRNSEALLEKLRQREALDSFVEHWFHDSEDGTLRSAFHEFEAAEVFEATLETHLRKLILRRAPAAEGPAASRPARWTQGSPFRGLDVFDFEHADVFFGRTRAVSEVIDHLKTQAHEGTPFVLVLGMSGGGKSSLARAGVIPLLTTPGVVEGVAAWRVAALKPSDEGHDPLDALANALCRAVPELGEDDDSVQTLSVHLAEDPDSVAERVVEALAGTSDVENEETTRLILLVDQLEELFTVSTVSAAEREAFGEAVASLVAHGIWTLATMRSDLYPRLPESPALLALKEGAGQYDLLPPTAAEISQMIRQPVLAAGLRLEVHPETGELLEDRLRDAAVGRPGSLPLLEFTLEELHRMRREDGTLTFEAFEELGGVEGSLARRAEGVWADLPEAVRGALPRVMRQLITIAESQDGHALGARRADLSRLGTDPHSIALAEALVEARLLTTDLTEGGDAVVRIAHEALLRHWPRLQEWIESDRETLKARGRLRGSAFRWAEEGRRQDLLLAAGKPLVDAQAVARTELSLSSLEQDFLDASQYRARRSVRLKRMAAVALVLLSVAAGGSALAAWSQAGRAAEEARGAGLTVDFMVGLFDYATPRISRGDVVTVRELLDQGGQRLLDGALEGVPRQRAAAARMLAGFQINLGGADSTTAGGAGLRRALELAHLGVRMSEESSESDSARASSYLVLGQAFVALSQYESAVEQFALAVDLARPEYANLEEEALSRWADAEREKGNLDAYRRLVDLSNELGLRNAEPGSLPYAIVLTRQGMRHDRTGEHRRAEELFRSADSVHRALGETETEDYTALLDRLATSLQAQGRRAAAHALLTQALEISRRILPPGHESIGTSLNNLAFNADAMNNDTLAARYWREAAELLEVALGPDAQVTSQVRNNLAMALLSDPQTRGEGLELMAAAVAWLRVHLPEGRDFTDVLVNYAEAMFEEGNFDEASALINEAVEVELAADRPGEAVLYLTREGVWAWRLDQLARADSLIGRAIGTAASMEDSALAGRNLTIIANYVFDNTELYEASRGAAEAALRVRRSLPNSDPELALSLADVAWWMAEAQQSDSADAFIEQAVEVLNRDASPVGARWLSAHGSIWFALRERGRFDEALDRERALFARLETEDADAEWLVSSQTRIGLALTLLGRPLEAVDQYDEALSLALERLNPNNLRITQLQELRATAVQEISAGSSTPIP